MSPEDREAARQIIVAAWRSALDTPYFYGGKPGNGPGLDCSGLAELGWKAAGVWPFQGDASAGMLWTAMPRVAWDERMPGDLVCFGSGNQAHHCVGVLGPLELVGANHGSPFNPGESEESYRLRMAGRGAKVELCGKDYWWDHRLGVVRAPALLP